MIILTFMIRFLGERTAQRVHENSSAISRLAEEIAYLEGNDRPPRRMVQPNDPSQIMKQGHVEVDAITSPLKDRLRGKITWFDNHGRYCFVVPEDEGGRDGVLCHVDDGRLFELSGEPITEGSRWESVSDVPMPRIRTRSFQHKGNEIIERGLVIC